jgi:diacylglycerol kinase (ATP)
MNDRGKWVFIVNPVAGSGAAVSQVPKLKEMIVKYGLDAEIVYTERQGHAEGIAIEYLRKGFDHFIGVGGDGTFNELVRPLVGKPGLVAGLIPAGTGNDFIQIVGFPGRLTEEHWDIFFNESVSIMDVGTVNGKIFMNGMGLGFDAEVASQNYTPDGKAREGSKNRYIWHIVKTLLFFREKRMEVVNGNDIHETDCFINTIAIGRRFAGGFLLTPLAIANDGLLDVCSIKRLSLPERFSILLKVPGGKHVTDKRINYFKTDRLTLGFTEKVPFHVDGELFFADKFDVGLIAGGINVIYNPGGSHFFQK